MAMASGVIPLVMKFSQETQRKLKNILIIKMHLTYLMDPV